MKEGLETAIQIIDQELVTAREINPVMALAMNHIKRKLEEKLAEVGGN